MDIILYLLQLIQLLYQQNCFLINFICKYIPLRQWAFDDSHSPKYQKFKIDELQRIDNFKELITSNKTGTGRTFCPITSNAMAKKLNQCSAVSHAIFQKTVPALHAVLLFPIFHGIMVRKKHRYTVRSVRLTSPQQTTTGSLKQPNSAVHIVHTSLLQKKTENTLSYISVLTVNALTTSTI